jgi:secondary thiamine-phosphate synthase enzyme
MKYFQKEITIPGSPRGFHLITGKIKEALPELKEINIGILQIFIQHTSAGLSLNENADPTVRSDFEKFFSRLVPDNTSYFDHTSEGADDMPAHIKNALVGNTVSVPVTDGSMNLGIWQGVYLCEFRNNGSSRKLVLTLMGS